jgi:hypothetical protein
MSPKNHNFSFILSFPSLRRAMIHGRKEEKVTDYVV